MSLSCWHKFAELAGFSQKKMNDLNQVPQSQPTQYTQSNQQSFGIDPGFAMMAQLYAQAQQQDSMAKPGHTNFEGTITKEKERIANRLANFNPKDTPVWREITQRFGSSIKQPELLSIATVLAQNANIKLDRDAKRRKSVLIKWFQENWQVIRPFLDYVVLEESHNQ